MTAMPPSLALSGMCGQLHWQKESGTADPQETRAVGGLLLRRANISDKPDNPDNPGMM